MEDTSESAGMSEAEKRRQKRRQRILENQGARLQRIVSGDSSGEGLRMRTAGLGDDIEIEQDDITAPPIEIFKRSSTEKSGSAGFASADHSHENSESISKQTPNLSTLLDDICGGNEPLAPSTTQAYIGVQPDGTVILPKISYGWGRILLCVLGIFLSLFNAKRYAVTFMSWEVAFYWLNGLPPTPPPNMVMVLVALMGLRETQLHKLKLFTHIVNCVIVDLSLFLASVMVPHIVTNVAKNLV